MRDLSILIVSKDDTFIGLLGELVRPLDRVHLISVPDVGDVRADHRRTQSVLMLVHQTEESRIDDVAELVKELSASRHPVPVVVLSDQHRPEEALKLLRLGVADYLSRPLDLNRLAYIMDSTTLRARHTRPRTEEDAHVVSEPGTGEEPYFYLSDTVMGRMMEQVRRVASQPTTVLLGGETGTGKTRLARLIHDLSSRRDRPFLVVNCGALSASLIESEMFGHARGSFTGADRDRVGKFEEAAGGTLLLDEIDSLPMTLQAKLLRVVEERIFEPVGSNHSQPMKARLIAACNRPLEQEVDAGRFRSDLYYRINVVSFELPPLRDRLAIIPHLAWRFAAEYASRAGRLAPPIDPQVLQVLQQYSWPGNIREIRNVLERAIALSDGTITLADIPNTIRAVAVASPNPEPVIPSGRVEPSSAETSSTLTSFKERAELSRILGALQNQGNNRLRAAAELGVSRMTLYKKLHKYGLMSS